MPPRHAYWTILVDDQPTAFRAHDAEELIPTLNRLKERHSSAVMKWFERGQLWDSRDDARARGLGRGERRWEGPRPDRSEQSPPRDRNWRPGGEHRDPRQKYKDAKKSKWVRFKKSIRDRAERRRETSTSNADPRKFSPPHGDPLRSKARREWQPGGNRRDQKNREQPSSDLPTRDRQRDERRGDRQERGRTRDREKPWETRPDSRPEDRHQANRPGDRRRFRDRTWNKSAQANRGGGKKPWGFKADGPGGPRGSGKGQRPRVRGQDQSEKRNPHGPRGPRGPRKRRDDE
jgi:hypothetical protein